MKIGNYTKKDLSNKNYALLSINYEDSTYYIEGLFKEKEKANKRWKYLYDREQKLMAQSGGWYAIDYIVVDIDNSRIKKCFNYEEV